MQTLFRECNIRFRPASCSKPRFQVCSARRRQVPSCPSARRDLSRTAALDDVRTATSSTVDAAATWERLSLVTRQLKVAVADEDYALAAKLRDEQKTLSDSLPPILQYALGQVSKLRTGTTQEQLQTIINLGEAGEAAVIPDLASCLSNPELADTAEKAMWAIFMKCKDPRVNELMQEGCMYMRSPSTYDKALGVFSQMIQLAPSYVEGYNKRATVNYLMGRHQASIDDCNTVLGMQPYHFGAASGMGLCLLQLSRYEEALAAFEAALVIHPGMSNIRRFVADLRRHVATDGPGSQEPGAGGAAGGR
ncbi:hypothetical protein HYH02_006097 [Chlamydomonas schloesseri]|uniref:Uncharacterized protein n=1 Tax=Chlamydomonas schloesseri TaxID=2026947 RepID=A0A835WK41_9CHLO|nr:hypothetical protein HYH02_006097 [Chlamydomonas schloesseri]|eukprot:KAG2448743.1 hypothetical protein HYH02_006097 [Chlamydomonas schloesseri]